MKLRKGAFVGPAACAAGLCSLIGLGSPHAAKADYSVNTASVPGPDDITIKDTDDNWTWSGMQLVSGKEFPNEAVYAGGEDTSGVVVFTGTGVKIFGISDATITVGGKPHPLGKMNVSLDGKQTASVDMSAAPPAGSITPIYQISGLTPGNHILEVKVTDGWGAISYVTVQNVVDDGGKDYVISPKVASDKRLDVGDDAMVEGGPVKIYSAPRPNHSQIWHVVSLGRGMFRISPKEKPDQCITVMMPGSEAAVNSFPCGIYRYIGHPDQQWRIIPDKPGFFRVYNVLEGKYLNVYKQESIDGTAVDAHVWPNDDQDNDLWSFVPVH